jgi:hypothetical protein
VTSSASIGTFYKIYSYEAKPSNGATVILTDLSTPFAFDTYVTIWDATGVLNSTCHVDAVLPTSFYIINVSAQPLGIYFPTDAFIFQVDTGTSALNKMTALETNVNSSISKSITTNVATMGTYYRVSNIFLLSTAQMYVTTTDSVNHFTVGSNVDIVGCTNIPTLNKTYSVTGSGSINSIVSTPPSGLVLLTYLYPENAYIYVTGSGAITSNTLSVAGPVTSGSLVTSSIQSAKITSPIYTTAALTDITISGQSGNSIFLAINGSNVLQVSSTAIIPYQPITGYLTSVLAASTYLTQTAGALLAPLASPVFSGVIKFPSASDQLSTAQMSINLGNTVSNNINLLTNKDTFTVVTNAVSSITGLNAFAGIHIQPFNVLGGQQDYYTGISWTSNVNITGSTHAGIYCRGTSYVGTRLHFCTTDNNLVGNKERMVLNQLGYLALNHTAPQTLLDVYGGVFNVWNGTRFAYGQSPLAGSIILGSTSSSYGGGTGASTASWQVGIMMETNANQEISVHHSGDSVRSLLYYEGGNHRIILGRNCGWGTSPVHTHDTLTVGSTLSVVGNIRPLGNTAIVWDTGNGIKGTSTGTYGNISTYGSGANAWIGYSCNDRYAFMMQDTDNNNGGIHSNSPNESWLVYWQGSGTGKSFNIAKKCSIGTTDAPSYTCHIRGNHCVQGGDDSKTVYGPNSTWGHYLVTGSGTNRCADGIGQIIVTSNNCHIDCGAGNGSSIYLNYYAINGGVGPANQNIQSWGKFYMNGLVNQNSNYSQIVSGINGAALMYSQFWSTISATQSAWAGGWSSANFNKTSAKSTIRFEGYCSYYVTASSMNYINVRIYNSYTGQYSYYNTNLFTNVTYNHAPCTISFCIKDIDAGFCNVFWYMSGSNWTSDGNDYITVTTIIQPD